VDEKRLRKYFSSRGVVTDAKVIRRKDGKSRCFGFVGFQNEKDASNARDFFDKTYMDTSRIQVEVAKARGSSDIQRPWSQHSKGSSRHAEKHPEMYTKEQNIEDDEDDEQEESSSTQKDDGKSAERKLKLQEFLRLSKASSSKQDSQSWADNPDLVHENLVDASETTAKYEDDEDDLAFLKSKTTDNFSDDDNDDDDAKTKKKQVQDTLADTGRLFLRNLSYQCEEDAIREAFSKYGKLTEVHVPVDRAGRRKGIAFVSYMFPEDAVRALTSMDAQIFRGRILHVLPAQQRKKEDDEEDDQEETDEKKKKKLSWKKQKEKKRREEANNEASWNTLFLRADTVVDRLAKHMKLKKSDILDRESNASMAVQMALAETHILETTKQQLEDAGVNLEALNQSARRNGVAKAERNDRVLLVKNLPAETKSGELTRLFAPFGEIGRFVFPEPNVIALIEFLDSSGASRAFRGLAYKRFKHVPLYLEWAPKNVFHNQVATDKEMASASVTTTSTHSNMNATTTTTSGEIDSTTAVPTLFVKNLNFATTTKRLLKAFQRKCQGVRSANVATRQGKRNKKNNETAVLSMGYGFVEFDSSETALTALKSAQGMVIDGHKIELRLSRKESADKVVAAEKLARKSKKRSADPRGNEDGDKLMVKNLAFEATRQEVRELFGSFGQLRSVRIPRKFDGGHRGFGFVEYISKQDAKNAFKQLTSTHFYGRRLVVEWAASSASIEDLRAKSKRELSTLKRTAPIQKSGDSTFDREQKFLDM
jgi:multiple RNA-binding domain-containing protein 1